MAEILEGENLIWAGRPTWKWSLTFILRWGLLACIPLVAGVALNQVVEVPITAFLAVTAILVALVLLLAWLRRLDTHYTVTDRRLIVRHGILNRNERSASLERIQNVNTGQGLLGRILNFGDVEFDTAGSEVGDAELALRGVNDPHGVRDILDGVLFKRNPTQSGL
jgi:uncharacterized membrane protein YdbT with pleckstrin-like domain